MCTKSEIRGVAIENKFGLPVDAVGNGVCGNHHFGLVNVFNSRWCLRPCRTLVHEFAHHCRWKKTGNPDASHKDKEYWGEDGFVNRIWSEIKDVCF